MDETKVSFWKNPIKWYQKQVLDSVEPTTLTHRIRMNIDIPKGDTKGRALIPCTIYSFDHSIDLNPALIRKKDGKVMKEFPVNTQYSYDSNKYDVQLTEEEIKNGYTLEELEKCEHCGQRLVIAEVAETRYRSCPDIKVRVSDPAKEDLKIPVDFGINKTDVVAGMWAWAVIDGLIIAMLLPVLFNLNWGQWLAQKIVAFTPSPILTAMLWVSVAVCSFLVSITLVKIHYKSYRLWKWWNEVKDTVTEVRVADGE
jgi:hypothetical protein